MKPKVSVLIHGYSGDGKSWAGATSPAPRLLIDAEGGGRFVPKNHPIISWDPVTQPCPEWDGVWQSCFVTVPNWATFDAAHQWLISGQHPFKSVVIDSITELQKKLVDAVAGLNQPTMAQWGEVLRRMEDKVRAFRDLTLIESNPLEAVIVLALATMKDGKVQPFVKGALVSSLPSFFDIVAYVYTQNDESTGNILHPALISPLNGIVAKDRTNMILSKYGPAVPEVDISEWLSIIAPLFA